MDVITGEHNMPSKKDEALTELTKLNLPAKYEDRAKLLINSPHLVNQSTFGVCGMASIIRALLEVEPGFFVRLLKSIFKTGKFTTAEGMEIKIDRMRLQTMFITNLTKGSSHTELAKNPDAKFELDFIVSRSLGEIAEKMDTGLLKEQLNFNKLFLDPDKKDTVSKFLSQGHLALQTKCLEFILEKIVGVKKYRKIKTDTERSFAQFVNGINKLFAKNPDTFAIVAINNFNDIFRSVMDNVYDTTGKFTGYSKKSVAAPVVKSFDYHTNKTLAKYTHWVVIKKAIAISSGNYKISFWSWAENVDDALILKAVAHTYMKEVIITCMSDDDSHIKDFDKVVDEDLQMEKEAAGVLPKGQSHIPSSVEWKSKFVTSKSKDAVKNVTAALEEYHRIRSNPKSINREKFKALKLLSHKLSECRHAFRLDILPGFIENLKKNGALAYAQYNMDPKFKNYVDYYVQSHMNDVQAYELNNYKFIAHLDDLENCIKKEKTTVKWGADAFSYIYSNAEWLNESWVAIGKREDIKIIDSAVAHYNDVFDKKGSKEDRLKALKTIFEQTAEYERRKGKTGSPRMKAVFNLERLAKKEQDMLRTKVA